MNLCACGCGELVAGTWKRGHHARGVGGFDPARHGGGPLLLPGPEDDPGGWPEEALPDGPPDAGWPPWDDGTAGEAIPEEPPLAGPPGKVPRGKGGKSKAPPKLSGVALRRDIHAKIRVITVPAAHVYQLRDPVCGGVAVQIEPGVSESLADIVLDSPDLIAWFTGPAGGFMKYFDLLSKLAPLGGVIWAHHIAHTISAEESVNGQAPARQYAA